MQHTVDTETDDRHIALGFQMDIRGALFKCKLPQPVYDIDDVLVIGIDLFLIAEFDQLLQILTQVQIMGIRFTCIFDRFCQREKLRDVLRNFQRIGKHQSYLFAADARDFPLPFGIERIGGCHHDGITVHFYRQDIEAGCVTRRHDVGNRSEINFQRIDTVKR